VGVDKGVYDDAPSFNLSYSFTINRDRSNKDFCDEAKRLIQERFQLDIEIRKLELQKLKETTTISTDVNNDW